MVATLCYQVQGSGFTFTRSDALDMSVGEAMFYTEWLEEQRGREHAAVKSAIRQGK